MRNKHLSLTDRKIIQQGIENQLSFSKIADSIGKNHTSISREIKLHRELKEGNSYGRIVCNIFNECTKHYSNCHLKCKDFVPIPCRRRDRYLACNGCPNKTCKLDKYYYYAINADKSYSTTLSSARQIPKMDDQEIKNLAAIIKPLIKNGQSIYQICENHPELHISNQTLYNYLHDGRFNIHGITLFDLKKVVSRKPRTKKKELKREPFWFRTREYKDYQEFKFKNLGLQTTEMDTVYNSPEGPYIQTFIFEATGFMIGILHKEKTSAAMASSLDKFQDKLTNNEYKKLFSLILTDRGSEFEKYDLFEINQKTGEIRCNIFYCDPQRPDQKPHVENNHNMVRMCIPNGFDLTPYTQRDIDNVFSHINSTPRKSLNGRTPYEVFAFMYGEEVIKKLGIKKISKDKVTLNPSTLFKK